MTRVGLLADTHGQLDARIAALLDACDVIVHAGDIGCISVLQRLRELAPQVVAVRGNNDVAAKLDAGSAALAELPLSESISSLAASWMWFTLILQEPLPGDMSG